MSRASSEDNFSGYNFKLTSAEIRKINLLKCWIKLSTHEGIDVEVCTRTFDKDFELLKKDMICNRGMLGGNVLFNKTVVELEKYVSEL